MASEQNSAVTDLGSVSIPAISGGSAEFKASALLSYDLAMLATASRYNLDRKPDRRQSAQDLVRFFFELIHLVDCDLFIEAGANTAAASRRILDECPGVPAVAFEANPFTFERHKDVNAAAGVTYQHLALTDVAQPVTFHVHRDEEGNPLGNGLGSILPKVRTAGHRERGFHEVTVEGVRLDDAVADYSFGRAAVWMDVEGACQYVLQGAQDTLSKTAVLIVEVEDLAYWGADHWLRERVVSYLYDFGLVPVARDFEFVSKGAAQYNIVFVRADLLAGPNELRAAVARFRSRAYGQVRKQPTPVKPDTNAAGPRSQRAPGSAKPSPPSQSDRLVARLRDTARIWRKA